MVHEDNLNTLNSWTAALSWTQVISDTECLFASTDGVWRVNRGFESTSAPLNDQQRLILAEFPPRRLGREVSEITGRTVSLAFSIPLHKPPPAKQNPLSEDDTKHQPAGLPPPRLPPSSTAPEQTHQ